MAARTALLDTTPYSALEKESLTHCERTNFPEGFVIMPQNFCSAIATLHFSCHHKSVRMIFKRGGHFANDRSDRKSFADPLP
ncbi:hypothetical protein [Vibrio sp. D431a]|uniref:hypothetical protein n=1 Tax=Vibrio sp. D431a TaxID=2837388 RepID=UPI00255298E5|nr:hypothetical protein [Vibrio sp. D431a]MDK9789819.1 hypothetical protein [Vibrio sp. D431a]